jgi:hypothetical protein
LYRRGLSSTRAYIACSGFDDSEPSSLPPALLLLLLQLETGAVRATSSSLSLSLLIQKKTRAYYRLDSIAMDLPNRRGAPNGGVADAEETPRIANHHPQEDKDEGLVSSLLTKVRTLVSSDWIARAMVRITASMDRIARSLFVWISDEQSNWPISRRSGSDNKIKFVNVPFQLHQSIQTARDIFFFFFWDVNH